MKVLNFKYFFTVLRLFPSCSKILFQSEAKWKAIDMKIIFYFHANKTCFQKNTFALGLVFRVICCCLHLPQSVIVLSGIPLTNNRKITAMTNLRFSPISRCAKWRHAWAKMATQDPCFIWLTKIPLGSGELWRLRKLSITKHHLSISEMTLWNARYRN